MGFLGDVVDKVKHLGGEILDPFVDIQKKFDAYAEKYGPTAACVYYSGGNPACATVAQATLLNKKGKLSKEGAKLLNTADKGTAPPPTDWKPWILVGAGVLGLLLAVALVKHSSK